MSSEPPKQKFVDNIGRRTWDVDAYASAATAAADAAAAVSAAPSGPRGLVEARSERVDLYSNVGKNIAVSRGTRAGFHCATCDVILSDSMAYLAHLNGRRHQKALGLSMQTRRASLADVRARLSLHRARLAAAGPAGTRESVAERLQRVQREQRQNDEIARAAKSLKRKQRKARMRGDDVSTVTADASIRVAASADGLGSSARRGQSVAVDGSIIGSADSHLQHGHHGDSDGGSVGAAVGSGSEMDDDEIAAEMAAAFADADAAAAAAGGAAVGGSGSNMLANMGRVTIADGGDNDDDYPYSDSESDGELDADAIARIQALRGGGMRAEDLEEELRKAQERAAAMGGGAREDAERRGREEEEEDGVMMSDGSD